MNQRSASISWLNLVLDESKPELTIFIRYDEFVEKLFKHMPLDMMKAHAAMGVAGEAGELVDAIKKEIIYGKGIDRDNLVEELGDLRFFIQAVQNLYGISETEVLQTNGYKLAKRYAGLMYSDAKAIDRADKVSPVENTEPGKEAQ